MDPASENTAGFLAAIQACMAVLREVVWRDMMASGARSAIVHMNLSGTPYSVHSGDAVVQFVGSLIMGLIVQGSDSREYDFHVDLMWDGSRWQIETRAAVANAAGGQDWLRELPVREATNLASCIEHLKAAAKDLSSFQDLVKKK